MSAQPANVLPRSSPRPELTEALGLDSYSIGEHHSAQWATTSPAVVLAAIAMRTDRIRLRTGVTLMPNLDPVRVAEDYATVDVLSGGRLDLTIGKGNFPDPGLFSVRTVRCNENGWQKRYSSRVSKSPSIVRLWRRGPN